MANTTISTGAGSATLAGVACTLAAMTATGKLYISEYGTNPTNSQSGTSHPRVPALRNYAVPLGSTAASSLPFSQGCTHVRLHSDAVCAVNIGGTAPAASTGLGGSMRLAAGVSEFYAVVAGDRLSVIATT